MSSSITRGPIGQPGHRGLRGPTGLGPTGSQGERGPTGWGPQVGTVIAGVNDFIGTNNITNVSYNYPFSSIPVVSTYLIEKTDNSLSNLISIYSKNVTTTDFDTVVNFSSNVNPVLVTVDATGSVGKYTSLAVVNGRPAISYYDDTPNNNLKYAIADDASGSVWPPSNIITVDAAGFVGFYTSLAVINGRPAISYYDASTPALKYAIADDASGSVWPPSNIITVDAAGFVGFYTSLAVVNSRPAISYFEAGSPSNLKYAIAGDASGSVWPPSNIITVDATGAVGLYTSLAVVNGRPAISYYDASTPALKYAIAGDASGSVWPPSNIFIVDATGDVGEYTSLAVVNGRPAISYYDRTNTNLKYAIAGDASGSVWPPSNIITVDAIEVVGEYTSLAVVNGRPAISYYDGTNTNLKYALAGDASGSVWPPSNIITVDTGGIGDVEQYTSLAVVNGRPAISYYDGTPNFNLKYAYPGLYNINWYAFGL